MRICVVGEGMLELSRAPDACGGGWRLGYGGDTLNTAIHLARNGHEVAYLTALGSDPFSAQLKAQWASEGLDTALVLEHPTRSAGLYAISTDDAGERSFAYWRDSSAARDLFALDAVDAAMSACEWVDAFAFSLISLAILPDEGRRQLLDLASLVSAHGGKVVFDGNYRPRLWPSHAEARHWRDEAIRIAEIGLPTLEDEGPLNPGATADSVAAHWQGLGCTETVVKLGPQGCRLPDGGVVPPPQVLVPRDTSGAGDAFNAGYLDARLRGAPVAEAAMAGHRLAGWVVTQAGAIPARNADAPYS